MSSEMYFSNGEEGEEIYLTYGAEPLPIPAYKPLTTTERAINTRDENDNIIPGQTYHFIAGGDVTGAKLNINIIGESISVYNDLVELFSSVESVYFSPDNGDTIYEGSISSESGDPEVISGTDILNWNVKLNIISITES